MSRYTPTEVPLDLLAGDQIELAAQHGQPVTIKVKVGGYRAMLPMTKAQIDKLKKGGRTIRLTPAHLKYLKGRGLCGRGIFGDIGTAVGPAVGSAVTAAASAIPGVGPIASVIGPLIGDAITGITGSIGKAIDRGIEKKSYNEQQAAKNFNMATQKAKQFLAMPQAQQMAEYERMKKIPILKGKIGSFDSYYARKAEQAKQADVTAEQQLDKRLAKKGLGTVDRSSPRIPKKRVPLRRVSKLMGGAQMSKKASASTLASAYIKAALEGRI